MFVCLFSSENSSCLLLVQGSLKDVLALGGFWQRGNPQWRWRGGGGELLLFRKHVSGPHNTTSMEMKQRNGEEQPKREQRRKRKKKVFEASTDDLTAETEFVFCLEMSDALPAREEEMLERKKSLAESPVSFSPSLFSSGLRRLVRTQKHQRPVTPKVHRCS